MRGRWEAVFLIKIKISSYLIFHVSGAGANEGSS
jgi:hypothetical protein